MGAAVLGGPGASAVDLLPTTTSTSTTTTTSPTTTVTESTTTSTTSDSTTTTTTAATTSTTVAGTNGTGLTITLPPTASLSEGTSVAAGSLAAPLGVITVRDSRGGLLAPTSWTATVTTTGFTNLTNPAQSIPSTSVSYASGPATAATGPALTTPGQLTPLLALPLGETRTAFTSLGNTGTSSVSWNPTIVVTFPAGVGEGQYQGTITHSVG